MCDARRFRVALLDNDRGAANDPQDQQIAQSSSKCGARGFAKAALGLRRAKQVRDLGDG